MLDLTLHIIELADIRARLPCCRFIFNLSLLNFHLSPTPSMCHQINWWRSISSAQRLLPNSYKLCVSESNEASL